MYHEVLYYDNSYKALQIQAIKKIVLGVFFCIPQSDWLANWDKDCVLIGYSSIGFGGLCILIGYLDWGGGLI